jgi:hypothetical protein
VRKETQLGLLAVAIVAAPVACGTLVVALCREPAASLPPDTGRAGLVDPQHPADPAPPKIEVARADRPAAPDAVEEVSAEVALLPERPRLTAPAREPVRPPAAPTPPAKSPAAQSKTAKEPAPAPVQEPEFNPFTGPAQKAQIVRERRPVETEPIEIIRAYLTEQLAPGEALKILVYSDPVPATFKRKKAVVLRVVYEVRGPKETKAKDQLFLVQNGEVKQAVDFTYWVAQLQRELAALAARQQAAQLVVAAQLQQQQTSQQALAGRLSQRPGNT